VGVGAGVLILDRCYDGAVRIVRGQHLVVHDHRVGGSVGHDFGRVLQADGVADFVQQCPVIIGPSVIDCEFMNTSPKAVRSLVKYG
jgi:hypothetical protein